MLQSDEAHTISKVGHTSAVRPVAEVPGSLYARNDELRLTHMDLSESYDVIIS